MASVKVKRAIKAFEKAVEDKVFLGTIPTYCEDADEQAQADYERMAIQHNYVKARAKLERLMENVL